MILALFQATIIAALIGGLVWLAYWIVEHSDE